jgi:basic membrane protein A
MTKKIIALLAVLTLVVSACGDDDATDDTTATTAAATTEADGPLAGDFNGDGKVLIAVATVGPRDDGAYSEALVSRVEEISSDNGFEAPLIVDLIDPAEGRTELENIIAQGPDIVAIGFSDLALGNEDLFATHDEIFWYCNCGSGFQDTPGLMRSTDSGAELNVSGGYAMGLLLQESGGDSAVFIGCCDLNFEVESFLAFEYGLQLVDPTFTAAYVPTGNFPFDFDNTAGATEAFNAALADGADAVYPFLGGAHEPIVQLANDAGLFVTTAGASNGCDRDDVAYDMMIKFDAGDYIMPIFQEAHPRA